MYYLADFYAGCATPKGFVSHGVSKVKTKKPSIHLFSAYPIQGGGALGVLKPIIPIVTWQNSGYTLDRFIICCRANT